MPSKEPVAKPATADENLDRAAFDERVNKHGLVLSGDEREGVYKLASWLSDGIARLAAVFPPGEPALGNPADLSIFEAGKRLRDGRLTSFALVRACLDRIAERDGTYRAFYTVTEDRALEDAARSDAELAAGNDRGPLHGLPIGIKDMIDVAGVATTAGSRGRADHIAQQNAVVVERLIAGGAVILGKLATYEWGTVGPAYDTLFPPARNPWSQEHITGGSSSGCAVAVAGGLIRTSVGSDTGGSLRGPASYCGVVGLKPTIGLVPARGGLGMSPSMDHIGPMSATSGEAAVTLDVISARTGENAAASRLGRNIRGLRIAYARNWFAEDSQAMPAAVAAMDDAASTLSELGARIEQVDLPDYYAIEVAGAAVLHAEGFAGHAKALAEQPESFGRKTYQSIAAGVAVSPAEYAEAKRAGAAFRATLDDEIFSRFEAMITVCALGTALPVALFGKGAVWTPMRTIGFNLTGHPVLALPVGFTNGLPLGMQIVGRYFDEARICQIGDAYERATDHAVHSPPAPPRSPQLTSGTA